MTYIDQHAPDLIEKLAGFHNQRPQHCNTYLLIDGVFDSRWFAYLSSQPALSWHALLASLPGNSKAVLKISPLLVSYAPDDQEMESLLRATSGKPMLSVLNTPDDMDLLSDRLARWCVVKADGQSFNFRFTDTRRLPGIVAALDAQQRGQLLGPTQGAHYVNRQGRWEALSLPQQPESPVAQRVELTDAQFAKMVADSEADEILAALAQPLPSGYAALAPSQRYARARLALTLAERHDQKDAPGRMALCRLTLEFPEWESDAACVEQVLKTTVEDTDRWERIAEQLRERNPT